MASSIPELVEHVAPDWLPDSLTDAGDLSLSILSCLPLERAHFDPQIAATWDESHLLEVTPSCPADGKPSHAPFEEESLQSIRYSCPYRKRNPGLFNVRDHPACAMQSFPTIPLLKRHIKTAHMLADFDKKCVFCGSRFRDQKIFGAHLTSKLCSQIPRPHVQSDHMGITKEMEDLLRDRRQKCQVKTWDGIWRTIFPGCTDVPNPNYEPIVEGPEAIESFFRGISELDSSTSNTRTGMLCGQGLEQRMRILYRQMTEQRR